MNRFAIASLLVAIAPFSARAEQEVTLRSGATLIGDVTFDGDAIVIDIDGAQQRVPLADVESVTPTGFGPKREARRLLLAALEARQLGGPPREALALLTEAARLDPDDPQIAYWHASTLVDAGLGKAADRTFESNRAAIEGAYPDGAAKLAERIRRRALLEMLPSEMVQRIDQFNAAAAVQPANAAIRPMAVAFRVLDQFNDPVPKSVFEVQASASDPVLEPYADGYFLYVYARRREESENPCRIVVNHYGFKSEQHEIRASSAQVAIAGEFTAHRYAEAEKRPFHFVVFSRDGAPVRGASIIVRSALPGEQGAPPAPISVETADDGKAVISAYPGQYNYTVSRDGDHDAIGTIQLNETESQNPAHRVTLDREIRARMHVVWNAAPLQPGGPAVGAGGGEADVEIGGAGQPSPPSMPCPLRLAQDGNRLIITVESFPYYAPGAPGFVSPWLKKQTAQADGDSLKRLNTIDLDEIAKLGDDFMPVAFHPGAPNYGQPPQPIVAQTGDLFVGQFMGRDPRTGQPLNFTIKALVTDTPGEASAAE
jgi:hypothetical protein